MNSSVLAQEPTEAEIQDVFKAWSAAYQKNYTSEEFQTAYQNWKVNFQAVNEKNKLNSDYVDGVVSLTTSSVVAMKDGVSSVQEVSTITVSNPMADLQISSVNTFSDMSYAEFASIYAATTAPEIGLGAAAAGLAVSTIAAIAAGGAVAVAAGTAATVVVVKRRRAAKRAAQAEVEMKGKEISNPTPIPAGSTNVFNMEPPHHSITARLFTGR